MMKRLYLGLCLMGFTLPSILVAVESYSTGNILLYADIPATVEGLFNNRISTIFAIDLLFTVLVFFIWSFMESKKYQIKRLWLIWIFTLLFGLAGGFPLFLYIRERNKALS